MKSAIDILKAHFSEGAFILYRQNLPRTRTIYRLATNDTIEEKIVKLHQEKRDLAGSDISGKISAEELIRLIREV